MFLFRQKTYEIQACRKGRWTIEQTSHDQADAETAAAGYLLAHAVRLSAMAGKTDMAIAELAKVPFKSAVAYSDQTVARLLQYLLGQGRLAEARAVRDALLTDEFFKGLPEASRGTTTERLADLMGWIAEDEAQWKKALGLRANKVSDPLLNFLPSKTLWSFAEDPMFSPAERALLARAAWTRNFARDRKIAAAQTEKLYALNPALKAVADKVAAAAAELGFAPRIQHAANPRVEAEAHYYNPKHTGLIDLGLAPTYLTNDMLAGMIEKVAKYKGEIATHKIFRGTKWA